MGAHNISALHREDRVRSGAVRGACPGAPRLSGTYLLTGLAHWATTNDIRALTGDQTVTTRAVALLPGVPKLVIPVPGRRRHRIDPTCLPQYRSSDPDANCAIVDFKLIEQDVEAGTGTVYVNWEDSEQGGDYDQDMKGYLAYKINAATNTITVRTRVTRKSTPSPFVSLCNQRTTQDDFRCTHGDQWVQRTTWVTGVNYTSTDLLTCSNTLL